jgi:hypothetical protein
MWRELSSWKTNSILGTAVLGCGILLAGCDDRIRVIRDPQIAVRKGNTWAWRPVSQPKEGDRRPVVSRDVIRHGETVTRESGFSEATRQNVRTAIEQNLAAKGLRQVSDPKEADFLVEYHVAVRRHDVTVEHVYPGGYPGLVCGPYGCWEGWGWGPPQVSFENVHFREGTVVLDLVQQSSHRLAFRVIGQKPFKHDTFNPEKINGFVHHMLEKLKLDG